MRDNIEESMYIGGRNSVREALAADQVKEIFLRKGGDRQLLKLKEAAEEKGIPVSIADNRQMEKYIPHLVSQGVVALIKPYQYQVLDEILLASKGKDPFLILLDGIQDVRNLGAVIRTAECSGAAAVLIPRNRNCQVTPAAVKASAGASSYMPVCRIGNIRQTLEDLKKKGFWVVGADMDGSGLYYEANMKGPLVIVIGAEGKGMSPLTKKMCDFCVRIPMMGQISSLNLSVAAALLLYEARKQRAGENDAPSLSD